MREIKFKTRHRHDGTWEVFTLEEISELNRVGWRVYRDWRQYTGLKDKNNKEIYEGDFVMLRHEIDDKMFAWASLVIEFEAPSWVGRGVRHLWNLNLDSYTQNCEMEIIGNIYENLKPLEDG